jgi:hypothetical protein
MSKKVIYKLFIFLILPLVSYVVYNYIQIFHPNIRLRKINEKDCKLIGNIKGVGKLIRYENYFIGTSDDWVEILRANLNKTDKGAIFTYYPETDKVEKIPIEEYPKVAFHPGSLHVHNNLLYVINHAYGVDGERIDSFKINKHNDKLTLIFQKSYHFGENFNGMFSDMVVLSHHRFYITVSKSKPDAKEGPTTSKWEGIFKFLTTMLGIKDSYLFYCNDLDKEGNPKCTEVPHSRGIQLNGLALDEKNKKLYVSDLNGEIKFYQFNNDFEQPRLNNTMTLDFNPDKVEYNEVTNKLYVGGVMRLKELIDVHAAIRLDKKNLHEVKSVSGGLEIDLNTGNSTIIVSQDKIGPVSTANRIGGHLIMGSLFDRGLLKCELNK